MFFGARRPGSLILLIMAFTRDAPPPLEAIGYSFVSFFPFLFHPPLYVQQIAVPVHALCESPLLHSSSI